MNKIKNIIILLIIIFATLFYFFQRNKIYSEETQILMDTVVTVKIYGKNKEKLDSIVTECFRYMNSLVHKLSNYIPDSEILKINKNAGIRPVKVDKIVIEFLKKSIDLCKLTHGYLDITIGKLIDLWGFPSGHPDLPAPEKIKDALRYKGLNEIVIDEKQNTVFIRKKGILIDVGAVAKGFIVDKAIKFLKKKGIKKGVINAGGDLRFIGLKEKNKYWIVGIKNPFSEKIDDYIKTVKIGAWAIATSGDYERFFIKNGKRYCHILNPFTGYPSRFYRSVTVEAENTFFADGLATAIFVMGDKYKEILKNIKIKHFKVIVIK